MHIYIPTGLIVAAGICWLLYVTVQHWKTEWAIRSDIAGAESKGRLVFNLGVETILGVLVVAAFLLVIFLVGKVFG